MDIRLYETTDSVKAVCQLTEKLYGQDKRIQIVCANQPMVVSLDQALWQFKQLSFLPHMTDLDGVNPETQPIFITSNLDDNLNCADVILSCNAIPQKVDSADLIGVCDREVSQKFTVLYKPDQSFVQIDDGPWQKRALPENV